MNSHRSSRSPAVGRNSYVDESLFGKFPHSKITSVSLTRSHLESQLNFILFFNIGSAKRTKAGPTMVTLEELRDIRQKTIKGE